jgi:N-acyl-L-homoserine lactone synthetase
MSQQSDAVGRAVAADLLTWLSPLRFEEAVSDADRREAFRLRYLAVVEASLESVERFPDGLEREPVDEDAVHIVGWERERAVATCRLVFARGDRPFPLEAAFALTLPSREKTVEMGRVTIDPQRRGEGHRLVMGLAARSWQAMAARGATMAIGVTPARLVTFFSALGFPVTVLGPPRQYWGEERVPILCEAGPAAAALAQLWGGAEVDAVLEAGSGGRESTPTARR